MGNAICRKEAEPTLRRGIGKLVIKQLVIREESHASLSLRSRGISMQMWVLLDAVGGEGGCTEGEKCLDLLRNLFNADVSKFTPHSFQGERSCRKGITLYFLVY